MNGKHRLVDEAARAAMSGAPQQSQINLFDVARNYYGLSSPVAKEIGMAMEDCLCGCLGKKIVFNGALHLIHQGGAVAAETFIRNAPPNHHNAPTNPEAEKLG